MTVPGGRDAARVAPARLHGREHHAPLHEARVPAARNGCASVRLARVRRIGDAKLAPRILSPAVGVARRGDTAAVVERAGAHLCELEPAPDQDRPITAAISAAQGAGAGQRIATELSAVVVPPAIPVAARRHGARMRVAGPNTRKHMATGYGYRQCLPGLVWRTAAQFAAFVATPAIGLAGCVPRPRWGSLIVISFTIGEAQAEALSDLHRISRGDRLAVPD